MKLINQIIFVNYIIFNLSLNNCLAFTEKNEQFNIISGFPKIIDGDTLKIKENRIRFYGIDAPENTQTCLKEENQIPCGRIATHAVKEKIGNKEIFCIPKKYDRYKRIIASCTINGEDIQSWMVRNGYALAYRQYSKKYITEEKKAKNDQIGIWETEFLMPWEWRKRKK